MGEKPMSSGLTKSHKKLPLLYILNIVKQTLGLKRLKFGNIWHRKFINPSCPWQYHNRVCDCLAVFLRLSGSKCRVTVVAIKSVELWYNQ